jgi:hypothetical protein
MVFHAKEIPAKFYFYAILTTCVYVRLAVLHFISRILIGWSPCNKNNTVIHLSLTTVLSSYEPIL